jgi:hypothetical protein
MAQQQINIGASANDGTGDTIRDAFSKVNENFSEVYSNITEANSVITDTNPQLGADLDVNDFTIRSNTDAGVVDIQPGAFGDVRVAGIKVTHATISTVADNADLIFEPQGIGKVTSSKISFSGGTIDGVTIGATQPADATFNNIVVNNSLQVTGGTLDNIAIGVTSPATGTFTNVTASEVNADLINALGNILPAQDLAFNIGSSTKKFATIFANTLNVGTVLGNVTGDVAQLTRDIHEKFQTKSSVGGTVVHDCAQGSVIFHTLPSGNFTVNLTNLNLSSGYATTITLIIAQGLTGYFPNQLQIDGVTQNINWQGNVNPSPTNTRIDVVKFYLVNSAGSYTVLAQLTGF